MKMYNITNYQGNAPSFPAGSFMGTENAKAAQLCKAEHSHHVCRVFRIM